MTMTTTPLGLVAALAPRPETAAPDLDPGTRARRRDPADRAGATRVADFGSVLADEAGTGAAREARVVRGHPGSRGVDRRPDRGHVDEQAVDRPRRDREPAGPPLGDDMVTTPGDPIAAGVDAPGDPAIPAGPATGAGTATGAATDPAATDDVRPAEDDTAAEVVPAPAAPAVAAGAVLAAAIAAPVTATPVDGSPAKDSATRAGTGRPATPAVPPKAANGAGPAEPPTPAAPVQGASTTAAASTAGAGAPAPALAAPAPVADPAAASVADPVAAAAADRAAASVADPAPAAAGAVAPGRAIAQAPGTATPGTATPGTAVGDTGRAPATVATAATPSAPETTATTAAAATDTVARPVAPPRAGTANGAGPATPPRPGVRAGHAATDPTDPMDPAVRRAGADAAGLVAAASPTDRAASTDGATPPERGRSRATTRAAGTNAVSAAAAGTAGRAADAAAAGEAVAATAATAGVDEADGSRAALDVPVAAGPADRVVAEALGRIRTAVRAGVPGLESRIDDPQLGVIRVVVSGRPGETIRAELIAADPVAARELSAALDRALAGGATLPVGVDLHVRTDTIHRPSAADAHLGTGAGGGDRTNPDGQAPDRRGGDAGAFGLGQDPGGARSETRAETQPGGRERRPASHPATAPVTPTAGRPGAGLDLRA